MRMKHLHASHFKCEIIFEQMKCKHFTTWIIQSWNAYEIDLISSHIFQLSRNNVRILKKKKETTRQMLRIFVSFRFYVGMNMSLYEYMRLLIFIAINFSLLCQRANDMKLYISNMIAIICCIFSSYSFLFRFQKKNKQNTNYFVLGVKSNKQRHNIS